MIGGSEKTKGEVEFVNEFSFVDFSIEVLDVKGLTMNGEVVELTIRIERVDSGFEC